MFRKIFCSYKFVVLYLLSIKYGNFHSRKLVNYYKSSRSNQKIEIQKTCYILIKKLSGITMKTSRPLSTYVLKPNHLYFIHRERKKCFCFMYIYTIETFQAVKIVLIYLNKLHKLIWIINTSSKMFFYSNCWNIHSNKQIQLLEMLQNCFNSFLEQKIVH